jgi:hypothetical protein
MFSPYAFQPNFPFLFFSLLRCVYGMRAPLVNQYTQPSSSLSHIVATWRQTRDLLPCMPTNNPMPCFAGGYKTKSHAPLLPNRSRWLSPLRATPPSTRSRVWDELVIVAIEAQQARGLALSMEHRRGTPRVGVNFPGEWIDYGGQNCSPSIRLSLSPAPTPPIRSPTTSVALARFAMAEYHLGLQLHGHTDDVRGICVCGKLGSRHHRGTVLWSSRPGTQNWRANMFSPSQSQDTQVLLADWLGCLLQTIFLKVESSQVEWTHSFFPLGSAKKGEVAETMKGHSSQVTWLAVDTNSDLISSSMDCTVRSWRNGNAIDVLEAHKVAVQTVLKLPTGELSTRSSNSTIKLWKGRICLQTFSGHAALSSYGHRQFNLCWTWLDDRDVMVPPSPSQT